MAVQSVGTFQYNPHIGYDFDDLDLSCGTAYPMDMGGSIFSGGIGLGMPMYSVPMMGGGVGNQSYFDYMKDYQKFNIEYNIDQQKMQRNADLRINASLEAVKGSAAMLKDKVLKNEQDQIPEAFDRYLTAVRAAYGSGTESELKARALTLYTQMNGGKTLFEDLRENAHGSYTQGVIQALTFGTYDRRSAEDNISDISGAPVGTSEKAKHNLGRLTGATALGASAFGVTKAMSKAAEKTAQETGKMAKFGGKAGLVGLIVGGAAALISFLTGKATT